ncbi:MAG: ribonuclease HI [Clostridia bacterium]|nr:ribonuclease HI [Clostridia bacterium]
MKQVSIYSDGACSGNPGPGGYGTILEYGSVIKQLSEGFIDTTNNRMELLGAIVGLEALKEPCQVTLYSDSRYLCESVNQRWVYGWQQRGWKKADKKPALNVDLWQRLLPLLERHEVTFVWIKGHAGHPMNEKCDALAVAAREQVVKENAR